MNFREFFPVRKLAGPKIFGLKSENSKNFPVEIFFANLFWEKNEHGPEIFPTRSGCPTLPG